MALYYKIKNSEIPLFGIQAHQINTSPSLHAPSIEFDFSKHVLIELLDNYTPEEELWEALDLIDSKYVVHKRLMIDSHRIHCRRAIVICISALEAKNLAVRVSQTKIIKRCVCAVVVQELLSDLILFEKQILNFGDERSQQQLVYVTDLNRCREPSSLATYLKEKFSIFGTILSVFVAEDKDGFAHPEGVIKFAYLSEAFAAELAYDQLVVGMERLSVTTHHNILLTQCDLRVRLRETLQNSVSLLENNSSSRNSTVLSKQLSKDNSNLIVYHESLEKNDFKPLDTATNFNQTKNRTLKNLNANSVSIKDVDSLMCTHIRNSSNKSSKISNNTSVLPLSTQEKINYSPLKTIPLTSNCGINKTPNINSFQDEHPTISMDNGAQIILNDKSTSCSFDIFNEGNAGTQSISENLCNSSDLYDSDWVRTKDFEVTMTSYNFNTNSVPHQKKNVSSLSNKLSLKSQRLDSRLQLSHLNLFFKSDVKSICQSPVVRLKRLTPIEIKKWTDGVYPNTSSVGQSLKLIPQKLDDLKVVCDSLVQEALLDLKTLSRSNFQTESPLRVWLKHELHYSSNNRVTGGCLENSKKVVYATTKQDILVSVGCSHMTCSSCYPRSTNLLFGFR